MDMLTKWAPVLDFPTCFVYDIQSEKWQIDRPVSPWVLEAVLDYIRMGNFGKRMRGTISTTILQIEGQTYWLGCNRLPLEPRDPVQIAGVFFSMDHYLAEDVPRLIDELVERSRFPLVPFQHTLPVDMSRPDGSISFRILDDDGEAYLQRGRTFDQDKMVYSELQYYQRTIVCMQEGWDLQIFSTNAEAPIDHSAKNHRTYIVIAIMLVLVSIMYWWGCTGK